jgi:hypothetical protein
MNVLRAIQQCSSLVLGKSVYRATKFLSPDRVVKVTRPHKFDRRARGETVVVTVGRPNFAERIFVKRCLKAGEPFPVRKIQVRVEHPKRKRG